ncbi:hypothetical protein L596_028448 [Steinernema carpocapsae]|uniref:Uncharacterized protein n=1 Tax=Steinernema carpocapsae TaxID=34508 RepID=A0A4U5LYJ5_STECR|nr:hypothetical protein L596_028448 [Steinernema carpocapsae]
MLHLPGCIHRPGYCSLWTFLLPLLPEAPREADGEQMSQLQDGVFWKCGEHEDHDRFERYGRDLGGLNPLPEESISQPSASRQRPEANRRSSTTIQTPSVIPTITIPRVRRTQSPPHWCGPLHQMGTPC